MRSTNTSMASGQEIGWSVPEASRSSGVVARSSAPSGVSASQPLGQAIPRFTG